MYLIQVLGIKAASTHIHTQKLNFMIQNVLTDL